MYIIVYIIYCYTYCKCYDVNVIHNVNAMFYFVSTIKLSDSVARFFPKTMSWSEKFYLDVMTGTTAKEQTTILQISTKYDPYFI